MNVTELFETPSPIDDNDLQLSNDGRLRHLLTLKGLSKEHICRILDEAETFLSPPGHPAVRTQALKGRTVANLFFEPSTRTRASFDLAARRLGADVLNLDVNTSSRKKGESILDTMYTLQAMQVDVFVVRDASAGVPAYIARNVQDHVSILNAGEAEVSHPIFRAIAWQLMLQPYCRLPPFLFCRGARQHAPTSATHRLRAMNSARRLALWVDQNARSR